MAVSKAAGDITAIALVDMENYVKSNRHTKEAVTEMMELSDVRGLVPQLVGAADADKARLKNALREHVRLNCPAVRRYKEHIHADLRHPRDRLIGPSLPSSSDRADVRLAIITDQSHKTPRVQLARAAKTRAFLEAAVRDGRVTEQEFAAFAANVNLEHLSDRRAVALEPSDRAPTAPEPSDAGELNEAARAAAEAQAAAALEAAEEEAKRVLSGELQKICRKILYQTDYVTAVDGATADEVIAALAHKLRPGVTFVVSNDMDFYQLQRYGITHVRLDTGLPYSQHTDMINDVFLLKCAVRGKGRDFINKWGPAFGPVPAGLCYPDTVGIQVTGDFDCSPEYRERFDAWNRMTGDKETGEPWNSNSVRKVLDWLGERKESAPADVRVRFLRNLCLQNIDQAHHVCVTPDDVMQDIAAVADRMIRTRGWAHLQRSNQATGAV